MFTSQGVYIQKGDIVSILDEEGGLYFAQIRGLMQDQYCEKSAVITWLLPTKATDPEQFDPATYILGMDEFCFMTYNTCRGVTKKPVKSWS